MWWEVPATGAKKMPWYMNLVILPLLIIGMFCVAITEVTSRWWENNKPR